MEGAWQPFWNHSSVNTITSTVTGNHVYTNQPSAEGYSCHVESDILQRPSNNFGTTVPYWRPAVTLFRLNSRGVRYWAFFSSGTRDRVRKFLSDKMRALQALA